jgi:hypothetical protein
VQYMLLIYGNEAEWGARTDDEVRTLMQGYGRLNDDLRAAGRLVRGDELQPVSTATSVRVRNDDTIVTDGPFAETKDVLGGFYLIEAETRPNVNCSPQRRSTRSGSSIAVSVSRFTCVYQSPVCGTTTARRPRKSSSCTSHGSPRCR